MEAMADRWPNLQELIDCGVVVNIGGVDGIVHGMPGVAIAMQERQAYAMLRIADGETLPALLDRLDAAVAKAVEHGVFTDEINR